MGEAKVKPAADGLETRAGPGPSSTNGRRGLTDKDLTRRPCAVQWSRDWFELVGMPGDNNRRWPVDRGDADRGVIFENG